MALPAYLLWDPEGQATKALRFDAVLQEKHKFTSKVTEHPVEEGSNISDHVMVELDKFSLTVFVTNTPTTVRDPSEADIKARPYDVGKRLDVAKYEAPFAPTPGAVFGAVGGAIASIFGGGPKEYTASVFSFPVPFDQVTDTLGILTDLRDAAQLVEVITPARTYKDMLITSVDAPRGPKDGDSITINIDFVQLKIVQSKQISAPIPTKPSGQKTKNKGVSAPVVPKAAQRTFALNELVNGSGADIVNRIVKFTTGTQ